MTKERPILFSAEMVRAIIEGRKSQTRRVVKGQHDAQFVGAMGDDKSDPRNWGWLDDNDEICTLADGGEGEPYLRCPYGVPGDRLWVQEPHYVYGHWEQLEVTTPRKNKGRARWRFVPDSTGIVFVPPEIFRNGMHNKDPHTPAWHLRPADEMTRRKCARLVLEVAEVRVERLQAITLPDCEAEGAPPTHPADNVWDSTDTYCKLWESINGPGSWAQNPWVWVIGFKVLKNGGGGG